MNNDRLMLESIDLDYCAFVTSVPQSEDMGNDTHGSAKVENGKCKTHFD